jgi:hypothetical protein
VERADLAGRRREPPSARHRQEARHLDTRLDGNAGVVDRVPEEPKQRPAMNSPAIRPWHDLLVSKVEDPAARQRSSVDPPNRRRQALELAGQAKVCEHPLTEPLEQDAGTDAAWLGDSLEDLDVVTVTREEQRRGRSRGPATNDGDSHGAPPRNMLIIDNKNRVPQCVVQRRVALPRSLPAAL